MYLLRQNYEEAARMGLTTRITIAYGKNKSYVVPRFVYSSVCIRYENVTHLVLAGPVAAANDLLSGRTGKLNRITALMVSLQESSGIHTGTWATWSEGRNRACPGV